MFISRVNEHILRDIFFAVFRSDVGFVDIKFCDDPKHVLFAVLHEFGVDVRNVKIVIITGYSPENLNIKMKTGSFGTG